jgi:hypothetical protein
VSLSQQGFIKLYRKVQEHWIYDEKRKFSKFEAWVDMLMMANHKDNKFVLGNELVEVKKGSFITSELKLMERWDWGKAKLRAFLEMLEKDEMIVKKSDRKKTTITICNYCIYHDYETTNRPQSDHEQTDSRPQSDTNKNVKNVKNVKNDKKNKYAEFVSMTLEEFEKLKEEFGEQGATDRIDKLNLYKGSTGKKYKSDYLTILNWERKNTKKENKQIDWEGL